MTVVWIPFNFEMIKDVFTLYESVAWKLISLLSIKSQK